MQIFEMIFCLQIFFVGYVKWRPNSAVSAKNRDIGIIIIRKIRLKLFLM